MLEELKGMYEIKKRQKDDVVPFAIEHELEKSIITKANQNNLQAINNTFTVKLSGRNRKKTGLTSMFDMIHGEAEPEYSYDIAYNENYILSAFL